MAPRCICCGCVLQERELAIPTEPVDEFCNLCLMYGDDETETKNHEAAMAGEEE